VSNFAIRTYRYQTQNLPNNGPTRVSYRFHVIDETTPATKAYYRVFSAIPTAGNFPARPNGVAVADPANKVTLADDKLVRLQSYSATLRRVSGSGVNQRLKLTLLGYAPEYSCEFLVSGLPADMPNIDLAGTWSPPA
jgi:hypothetical protein